MAWKLSPGFVKAIQNRRIISKTRVNTNTLTFTNDKIQDSGNGLGDFKVGDFIHVIAPTNAGTNDNIIARCIAATAAELTFASNTFTALASGTQYLIQSFSSGSIAELMKNSRLDLFNGTRPTNPEDTENGTLLVSITLNAGAFVSGDATNGINLDTIVANALKRAIDPATGNTEIWQGIGIANGTAQWGRWYANDAVTGASTDAVRMDGNVGTTVGADIVMANGRDVVSGAPATVTDVSVTVQGV